MKTQTLSKNVALTLVVIMTYAAALAFTIAAARRMPGDVSIFSQIVSDPLILTFSVGAFAAGVIASTLACGLVIDNDLRYRYSEWQRKRHLAKSHAKYDQYS